MPTDHFPIVLAGDATTDGQQIARQTSYYHGRYWHSRINPSKSNPYGKSALLNKYSEDELRDKLVVCYSPSEDVHVFSAFEMYEFQRYQDRFAWSERCFHEVVMRDHKRKDHYDLDISDMVHFQAIFDAFIKALLTAYQRVGTELKFDQIVVFTSHSATKKSYHIYTLYYMENYHEQQYIHDLVVKHVPDGFRDYIDPATRRSRHNLRMLNNTKPNEERWKVLCNPFMFDGQERHSCIDINKLYEHSILTYVNDCQPLNISNVVQSIEQKRRIVPDIPDGIAKRAIDLLYEQYSRECLEYVEVKGNIIVLKNVESYHCHICKVEHDSENPYLLIQKNMVYYQCRRAGKGCILGFADHTSDDVPEEPRGRLLFELIPGTSSPTKTSPANSTSPTKGNTLREMRIMAAQKRGLVF